MKKQLTKNEKNYLLNNFTYYSFGQKHSIFIIEGDKVLRKDMKDKFSIHDVSEKELSFILSLMTNQNN